MQSGPKTVEHFCCLCFSVRLTAGISNSLGALFIKCSSLTEYYAFFGSNVECQFANVIKNLKLNEWDRICVGLNYHQSPTPEVKSSVLRKCLLDKAKTFFSFLFDEGGAWGSLHKRHKCLNARKMLF